MNLSDEQLMAFADGELEGAERAAVEAASARDPAIARRIERYRAQRGRLQAAFDPVLGERVPQRLMAAARAEPGPANRVVDLDRGRTARARPAPRGSSWPQWTAIAASLLVGLVSGRTLLAPKDLFSAGAEGLVAGGALEAALTERPSGAAGPVAIGFSYRAQSGEYCRTFTVHRDAPVAGIACREGDAWDVRALSQVDAPISGEYRMAGAELPPLLLQAVEAHIEGEPLDAAEESAARRAQWMQ